MSPIPFCASYASLNEVDLILRVTVEQSDIWTTAKKHIPPPMWLKHVLTWAIWSDPPVGVNSLKPLLLESIVLLLAVGSWRFLCLIDFRCLNQQSASYQMFYQRVILNLWNVLLGHVPVTDSSGQVRQLFTGVRRRITEDETETYHMCTMLHTTLEPQEMRH